MTSTLLLNADYQPVTVVPISALHWQEAIKAEWLAKAITIEEYDDWVVHSPSTTVRVPSIMVLNEFVRPVREIKFSRYNVFVRDEFRCQYCGFDGFPNVSDLTIDHVTPRFNGGTTVWDNVSTACEACNLKKANHTKMKPNTTPRQPDYFEMVSKRKKFPVSVPHKSWVDYLDWDPALIVVKPVRK